MGNQFNKLKLHWESMISDYRCWSGVKPNILNVILRLSAKHALATAWVHQPAAPAPITPHDHCDLWSESWCYICNLMCVIKNNVLSYPSMTQSLAWHTTRQKSLSTWCTISKHRQRAPNWEWMRILLWSFLEADDTTSSNMWHNDSWDNLIRYNMSFDMVPHQQPL